MHRMISQQSLNQFSESEIQEKGTAIRTRPSAYLCYLKVLQHADYLISSEILYTNSKSAAEESYRGVATQNIPRFHLEVDREAKA